MTTITERTRIARRRRQSSATLTRVTAKPQPTPRYRAHCDPCKWTSREFSRYSTAETAARGHADEKHHAAYVLDQYGLRVTGSTVRPGEGERA